MPQASIPPTSGDVIVRSGTWRITVPVAVLTALVSAFGARMLPTPTASDREISKLQMELQTQELNDAMFRTEMRQDVKALTERVRISTENSANRIQALEIQIEKLEQRLERGMIRK